MNKEQKKPPVVVVLGHVDHGKTTLLDALRDSKVADSEFGKITQHIGAYEIKTKENRKITFIDTPGHEAFNTLRSRGAKLADLALLIVAADSSVKPQTVEALKQIRLNKIPFIVVINKIDLETANVEKVIKDLSKQEVYLEGRGGEVPFVPISAQKKTGLDTLLELIVLVADLQNLTYSESAQAEAVVVETKKDRRGIVLSIVPTNGKLKIGDVLYSGSEMIKVRALFDDLGKNIGEIKPSTPAELLGSKHMVDPGSVLFSQKQDKPELVVEKAKSTFTEEDWHEANQTKFNFIIKTDTIGTLEAIREKFAEFEEINIIKADAGELTEANLELAKTTGANILAFNTKIRHAIKEKIEKEDINIFQYNLIYELLDQVEDLIYALRTKQEKEARRVAEAKILAKFVKGEQIIAGLKVLTGKLSTQEKAEVVRGKKILGETTISSLYRKSSPVPFVTKGDECGAIFSDKIDFKQGDIVKLYS
jgi:translation initiation factor IF-2